MTGTYKLHNFVTGHYYIGATLDVFDRYTKHLKDIADRRKPKKWQRAWDKHHEMLDLDTWECLALQEFETLEEAVSLETELLAEHVGRSLCLNVYKTTEKQGSATQEARDKISEANSNPSDETRRRLSESKKGENNYWYGKPGLRRGTTHTDEARAKMSEAHTGLKHSDETRAKISAAKTGKKHSPETRAKLKAAHARRRAKKFFDWLGDLT